MWQNKMSVLSQSRARLGPTASPAVQRGVGEGQVCDGTAQTAVDPARVLSQRVKDWVPNLEEDILRDSVESPFSPGQRWLLYFTDRQWYGPQMDLCASLAENVQKVFCSRTARDKPKPKQAPEARANGMW